MRSANVPFEYVGSNNFVAVRVHSDARVLLSEPVDRQAVLARRTLAESSSANTSRPKKRFRSSRFLLLSSVKLAHSYEFGCLLSGRLFSTLSTEFSASSRRIFHWPKKKLRIIQMVLSSSTVSTV